MQLPANGAEFTSGVCEEFGVKGFLAFFFFFKQLVSLLLPLAFSAAFE